MGHAYTPGLRVSDRVRVRRERRLPLKGHVRVMLGDAVGPDTVVASTNLPGNVQMLNLAAKLALDPTRVPESLLRPIGSTVRQGEVVAQGKSLFGLLSQRAQAPVDGTIESVSSITGQLILREPSIPIAIHAYVRGTIAEILPGEGAVVEAEAALMQGIFGVGGETFGPLSVVARSPDDELTPERIDESHRGRVVVGGCYASHATLMRARDLGVTAVVVGGFDDHDLRQLLGRDLGVAITGSEELGLTLVLTEGFGRIPMAERTWRLLASHDGEQASVSGATQIRSGVLRPEVLVPHTRSAAQASAAAVHAGLEVGSLLRVIREPYFGRIAHVVELPVELQALETEARVRVARVQFSDDGSRAIVPRANVELIEP